MAKQHHDIDTYSMCMDYNGNSVFNDSDEEMRYQAFKERLMRELVRDGLVVGDKKWKLVVESSDRTTLEGK